MGVLLNIMNFYVRKHAAAFRNMCPTSLRCEVKFCTDLLLNELEQAVLLRQFLCASACCGHVAPQRARRL